MADNYEGQAKNQRIANGSRSGPQAPFEKTKGALLRKGAFING